MKKHLLDSEDSRFLDTQADKRIHWTNTYERKSLNSEPSGWAWEFNKGPKKHFNRPKNHKKSLRDHRR